MNVTRDGLAAMLDELVFAAWGWAETPEGQAGRDRVTGEVRERILAALFPAPPPASEFMPEPQPADRAWNAYANRHPGTFKAVTAPPAASEDPTASPA